MPFIKHDSSQIHSTSHNAEDKTLIVRFNCRTCGGTGETCPAGPSDAPMNQCPKCEGAGHLGTYQYQNVDADLYGQILDAESVGSMFHKEIKSKAHMHPYEKI